MFRIRVERVLDKNVEEVFDAITDHANYKRFPGISDSVLLEEGKEEKNGEGALRKIVSGSFKFTERITRFEKTTNMNYHIEAMSPIPVRHDKGEITIQSVDGKTKVLWVSEGHMNVPIIGSILDKIVESKLSKAFGAILKYIETH